MREHIRMELFIHIYLTMLGLYLLWLFIFKERPAVSGPARLTKVLDGDTLVVSQRWRKYTIRLDAIDCPELDQPWGKKARSGLKKLLGRNRIKVEVHSIDHYGRTLATVFAWNRENSDWMNVNARMVVLGHAWVYGRYLDHLPWARRRDLQDKESWARSKRVGLWRYSNPTPPWNWRTQGSIRGA